MLVNTARIFLAIGVIFLFIGVVLYVAAKLNLPLGRLPGDIRIEGENFACFFPVATMLLLSLLLTLILNLAARLLSK